MAFMAGAIVSKLSLDRSKFSASIKAVQKQTKSLGGWVKQNSEQFKKMGKMIGIAGIAAAAAIGFIVKRASEAQEITSKFMTVFAAVMAKASAAVNELTRNYGLSRVAAKELLGMTGDLLSGLGTQADVALDLSLKTQKLAVDLASFSNFAGGAKGASEALTKAMLGERESVKALGIVITEEMVKEQLLREGKENLTGQALLQAKAYASLQIATEQSKNAIGDYQRTSTSFANITRTLSQRLDDLWVILGKNLVPVFAFVAKGLTKFTEGLTNNEEFAKKWTKSLLGAFQFIAKGIEGLMLAWNGLKTGVFIVAEAITQSFVKIAKGLLWIAKLTPGTEIFYAEKLEQIIKDLTAVSGGYREEKEKGIDTMTDIIAKYEAFVATLNKVNTGTKKAKKETKSFWETLLEGVPSSRKVFEALELEAKKSAGTMEIIEESWEEGFWKIFRGAVQFTSALSDLFNQMSENQIANIDKEYEARKKAIDSSLMTEKSKTDAMEKLDEEFDKKRRKAMRTQAARTKAVGIMEGIIHTASAVIEALPNIPLAIAVGIMGGIQTALIAGQTLPALAKGGRLGRGQLGIVGEEGPELFAPDTGGTVIPMREGAGLGTLRQIYLTIAPSYQISTIDEIGVDEFMRNRGLPAMVEAIKVGIMKPELQDILRIK